jgi:hypothetical protein
MGDQYEADDLEDELFADSTGCTDYLGRNPHPQPNPLVAEPSNPHPQPNPLIAEPSSRSTIRAEVDDIVHLFDNLLRTDAKALEGFQLNQPTTQVFEGDAQWQAIKPGRNSHNSDLQPKNPFTQWIQEGFGPAVTGNWKDRQEDMNRAKQIALHCALPKECLETCRKAAVVGNIRISLTDLMRLTSAIFYAPIPEVSKKALLQRLSRGSSPFEVSAELKAVSSLPKPVSSIILNPPLQRAQSAQIQPKIPPEMRTSFAETLPEAPKSVLSRTQSSVMTSSSSNISEEESRVVLKASGSVKYPELKTKLATWSQLPPDPFVHLHLH